MKKFILAIAVLAFSGAATASHSIKVAYGSGEERIKVDDLRTVSVCAFKMLLADKYDLKIREFDLLRGTTSAKLDADKTLYGAGIRQLGTVTVKPVSYSRQCN